MSQTDHQERELFLAKAQAFLDNGLCQEAEALAEIRLSHWPDDIDAKTILCQAWVKTGRLHKVKAMLRDVEDVITDLSRLHLVMGDICRKAGLTQEAIRFYGRFIALNPHSERAKEISEKLNRMEDIQDEWPVRDMAEKADGKGAEAQISPDLYTLTLADIYMRQKHYDMAREVLEAVLRKEPDNGKAADMIREIDRILNDGAEKDMIRGHNKRIVGELTRWLQNLSRVHRQAMP